MEELKERLESIKEVVKECLVDKESIKTGTSQLNELIDEISNDYSSIGFLAEYISRDMFLTLIVLVLGKHSTLRDIVNNMFNVDKVFRNSDDRELFDYLVESIAEDLAYRNVKNCEVLNHIIYMLIKIGQLGDGFPFTLNTVDNDAFYDVKNFLANGIYIDSNEDLPEKVNIDKFKNLNALTLGLGFDSTNMTIAHIFNNVKESMEAIAELSYKQCRNGFDPDISRDIPEICNDLKLQMVQDMLINLGYEDDEITDELIALMIPVVDLVARDILYNSVAGLELYSLSYKESIETLIKLRGCLEIDKTVFRNK